MNLEDNDPSIRLHDTLCDSKESLREHVASLEAALSTEAEKVRKLREALQNIADYPATQEGQDDWEEIEKGWELLADAARIALKETED